MPSERSGEDTRRWIAAGLAGLAVLAAVALVLYLPPDLRHLLIGRTVEHCPESEFSCPGQTFGLLHALMALVIPFLIYFEGVDEDG